MNYKSLLTIFMILTAFVLSAMQNEPDRSQINAIFIKGLEYFNNKEYIKAVQEWDQLIDNYGYVDIKLKNYYRKAYDRILSKQRLLMKGLDYYKEKNYPEAIVIFNSVLQETPYDATAKEYIEKSKKQLERINKEILVQKREEEGDRLYQQKEYLAALEKYRTVLVLAPDNITVMEKVHKLKALIDEQERLAEIDRHLEQGRAFLEQRKPDFAIEELNYVLGLTPDFQEARDLLQQANRLRSEMLQLQKMTLMMSNAVRLFNEQKYGESLDAFNEILVLNPQDDIASDYKARILAHYDSLKQQEIFRAQLEGFYSQGVISYNARNYQKSRENFMNVISLNSNYKDVNKYLTLIQDRINEERAKKIQEQQDKILEYLNSGITFYQVGEYKNAIFELSRCLDLDPENIYAKEYLDKAKEVLFSRSQEEIDDDSPYYEIVMKLYFDSIAFFNKGDYQTSMSYLEKILLLFPNNKLSRDLLVKNTLMLEPEKVESFLQSHYDTGILQYHNRDYANSKKSFTLVMSIRQGYKNVEDYLEKIEERLNPPAIVIPLETLRQAYEKGLVYYSEGKIDLAKKEWEKVLQDNSPRNTYRLKAIMNLNKINLRKKYQEETSVLTDQGRMSDKEIQVNQFYLKGVSFYMNGDYVNALKEWERGLKIDPQNPKLINSANKCRMKLDVQKTEN